MKKSILEVDIKGLRELQAGKPMWFVVRELIQNAFDEDIQKCTIKFGYEYGKATISVEDDSPNGFSDLSDAYTLFKHTRKRHNAHTRGRFNLGEKQVLCLCSKATILTTTGGLLFDDSGRHTLRKKREKGSIVTVEIKMSREDYNSCIEYCRQIFVPKNVVLEVFVEQNEKFEVEFVEPFKKFNTRLTTELSQDGMMRKTVKETDVYLHKVKDVAYIYEMGIPVCEIDCNFSVDVQQKIPLNTDRDNVDQKFLKTVYAEVLNVTHDDIPADDSSNTWIRVGTQSDRITKEAVQDIFTKRYGEKAVIANPFDKKSIDSAITNGYRVIGATELSKEERSIAKKYGVLKTSSEEFPVNYVDFSYAQTKEEHIKIASLAKKIFVELMGLSENLRVEFIESPKATTLADFNASSLVLRYNLAILPSQYFHLKTVNGLTLASTEILDLTIHELAHYYGTHYERAYLDACTRIGALMTNKALEDPNWFDLK